MIRIAHIITGLGIGGAEMMLAKLLSRTDRSQFEPFVISLSDQGVLGERIKDLHIPVSAAGMKPGRPMTAGLCRLVSMVRSIKPDLIQGWMNHGNLAAQLSAFFQGHRVPVIWNIRQSIYSLAYYKKMTMALMKMGSYLSYLPEAIIYNSRTGAAQHEAIGFRRDKRIIIPNGFDVDTFKPDLEAVASVRTELGIPSENIVIGLIASYSPLKDHATFLKAASLLLEKYSGVRFILAGLGIDGNNGRLRSLLMKLNISKSVYLLGERFDIPRLTACMDIASSSSYAEGFSNVIGEAMSCGVPCVVTDVGDSALLVGDTGLIVEPRNPKALCDGWKEIIEMPTLNRRRLGERARDRIIENFSIDAVCMLYDQLYGEVFDHEKRRLKGC